MGIQFTGTVTDDSGRRPSLFSPGSCCCLSAQPGHLHGLEEPEDGVDAREAGGFVSLVISQARDLMLFCHPAAARN